MGRQAERAIRLFVADQNAGGGIRVDKRRLELALECQDDCGDPARCAEIYRSLCLENRADLIFGPYSSALTRVAAPIAEQAGMVMVNHGGADDDLYRHKYRLLIGILSPASDYLLGFAQLLSTLKFWRKHLALVVFPSPFARAVIDGLEQACKERRVRRRGVRLRLRQEVGHEPDRTPAALLARLARARVNALASAGGFDEDVSLMRAVVSANFNIPVLACVAAGVRNFGLRLGPHADGIIGPSQWEPGTRAKPDVGATSADFVERFRRRFGRAPDYPSAQAYAVGLILQRCVMLAGTYADAALLDIAGELECRTFYGRFQLDPETGAQVGHEAVLVQWQRAEKRLIWPVGVADAALLYPKPRPTTRFSPLPPGEG